MKIRPLPKEVIAKLRSGISINSVVQCVDELLQNAIDAEATCVAVRLDLQFYKIQVIDNGRGMDRKDLKMLGERYATSKCHSLEDLKSTCYYGHRGEAIASICEISQSVTIVTKASRVGESYVKSFHDSTSSVSPAGVKRPSNGTTVTVCGFLCKYPVRQGTINAILDVEKVRKCMESLAIINPGISFSLRDDTSDTWSFRVPATVSAVSTFAHIFGPSWLSAFKPFQATEGPFTLKGHFALKGHRFRNLQFLYVQRRRIVDSKLQQVINQQYGKSAGQLQRDDVATRETGTMPLSPERLPHSVSSNGQESFPVFVLEVKCPRQCVDIGLHPSKTVVEFKQHDVLLKLTKRSVSNFFLTVNCSGSSPGSQMCDVKEMLDGPPLRIDVQNCKHSLHSLPVKRQHHPRDPLCGSEETEGTPQTGQAVLRKTGPSQEMSTPDSAVATPSFRMPETKYTSLKLVDRSDEPGAGSNRTAECSPVGLVWPLDTIRERTKICLTSALTSGLTPLGKLMDKRSQQERMARALADLKKFSRSARHRQVKEREKTAPLDRRPRGRTSMSSKKVDYGVTETLNRDALESRPTEGGRHNVVPLMTQHSVIMDVPTKGNVNDRNQRPPDCPGVTTECGHLDRVTYKGRTCFIPDDDRALGAPFVFLSSDSLPRDQNLMNPAPSRSKRICLDRLVKKAISSGDQRDVHSTNDPPTVLQRPGISKPFDVIASTQVFQVSRRTEVPSIHTAAGGVGIPCDSDRYLIPRAVDRRELSGAIQVQTRPFNDPEATPLLSHRIPQCETGEFEAPEVQRESGLAHPPTSTADFPKSISEDVQPPSAENQCHRSNSGDLIPCNQPTRTEVMAESKCCDSLSFLKPCSPLNLSPRLATRQGGSAGADQCDDRWLLTVDPCSERDIYVHHETGHSYFGQPPPPRDVQPFKAIIPGRPIMLDTSADEGHRLAASLLPLRPWQGGPHSNLERNSQDEMRHADQTVEDLLKLWKNPVFEIGPLQVTVPTLTSGNCLVNTSPTLHLKNQPYTFTKDIFKTLDVVAQVDQKFIVCRTGNVQSEDSILAPAQSNLLILFDQHAVHERIRLEDLIAAAQKEVGEDGMAEMKSVSLDQPLVLNLPTDVVRIGLQHQRQLSLKGLEISSEGEAAVKVTRVPCCLVEREASECKMKRPSVIAGLVENLMYDLVQMLESTGSLGSTMPKVILDVLKSQACHGAIKFGEPLTIEDCGHLMKMLAKCQLPFHCAHGRPSVVPLMDFGFTWFTDEQEMKPRLWKLASGLQKARLS